MPSSSALAGRRRGDKRREGRPPPPDPRRIAADREASWQRFADHWFSRGGPHPHHQNRRAPHQEGLAAQPKEDTETLSPAFLSSRLPVQSPATGSEERIEQEARTKVVGGKSSTFFFFEVGEAGERGERDRVIRRARRDGLVDVAARARG